MIKQLRRRFILIATLCVTLVLFVVIAVLNTAYYLQAYNESQSMVSLISQNQGQLPQSQNQPQNALSNQIYDTAYQAAHYLTITTDQSGKVIDQNGFDDISISQNRLKRLLASNQNGGLFFTKDGAYIFQVTRVSNSNNRRVVFLDISSLMEFEFFWLSLRVSFINLILFVCVISLFSGRLMRPFIKSYEKQRRFITNASHELKTPVAIISANNELQEMISGETEWTKSTADQTKRLTEMITQLVTLARLEEQAEIVLHDLDFSAIVQDAAEDFKSSVIKDGKTFHLSVAPGVQVKAEQKSLFELVTILVDNANKYCDPKGTVSVTLEGRGRRRARLIVSNTFKEGKSLDYSKFFERFYREDESHHRSDSASTTGFGVGLSTAQSMVALFKGKITVRYKKDTISFIVLL
ncbi:sensor histidine kinase [Streptococcus sp. DD12]|uniref:sensor histidine kinase n=1 Tax=Streptococcus sp. DD12 TaxID=1777880 RepID=UPI0007927B51|nr:HAMP domain-containing sensor histidine kinase [Streptococcus sp. DD12]KXT76592.1 Two component system histidine kinase [Streptococcus sp. DD12]